MHHYLQHVGRSRRCRDQKKYKAEQNPSHGSFFCDDCERCASCKAIDFFISTAAAFAGSSFKARSALSRADSSLFCFTSIFASVTKACVENLMRLAATASLRAAAKS